MVTRNGSQWCTAEFVGKDVLLTAGHCVHSGGSGGAFYASSSFKFYPGRNGSSSPYGYCSARSAGLYTFSGWANSADEKHDLGFIKLSCTKGTTVGTFGFWWQTASEAGLPATVRGYPGDKPAGTLWTMDGTISTSQQYQNFYLNDTFGGQSGSPVYQNRKTGSSYCAGYCIHTNHSYGVHGSTAPHSNQNHGRRITQAASDLIIQLKNQA
jgi:glutamyl endopeptidase